LGGELLRAWVHLAVLWAFAFAKPLFDVLADSPEFFVARGNTSADILIFSIALILIPPSLLVAVEAAAARLPRARRALHLLFVFGLSAGFAVQLLDDALEASSEVLILGALVFGALAALAYARSRAAPAVLTVLAPVPLIFLLLFLFASSVSKLVLPEDADAADVEIRSRTPVVVVVLDELDPNMLLNASQRIDRTRYPNIAALASDSTLYPNATTVNSQTTLAVPAILSGRRPQPNMLPVAADYPNSLPTMLAGSHDLRVIETATEVCPERLCGERARDPAPDRLRDLTKDLAIVSLHLVAPERMEHRLPAVDQTFADFGGGGKDEAQPQGQPDVPLSALTNRPSQWEALVRSIGTERHRPGLHFLHAALPHIPWQYLPSGQQYINAGPDYPGLENEAWSADTFPPRLGLQRHLLQVRYVDRLVGRLVARLRAAGIYDRSMVVLTADHGVSFRPGHPRRGPDPENLSDIAGVPLLIKYPGRAGGAIDDSPVRTIDIVPTIAAELGERLPWDAEGRPIGSGPLPRRIRIGIGGSGRELTAPVDDFVRNRKAALRRMIGMFGSDDGGRRLYANGANWDLLGRATRSLSRSAAAGARAELDSADLLDGHRPGARLVPSYLSGRLTGGIEPGASLAVAVNGRIRAVTESFDYGGEVRMAAVIPPGAFRAGENEVEVLEVRRAGASRQLAALLTERPESFRLVERGGATIVVGEGRQIELQEERLLGYLDSVEFDDQGVRLGGWAVDPRSRRAVDSLLVFSDGRLVARGQPTLPRPDIGGKFGAEAVRSGFDVRAAVTDKDASFRIVALADDAASELPAWNP
jgi:hypothetical protein